MSEGNLEMELETSKNIGGIGALLLVIGSIAFIAPYGVGGIVSIIGFILVLVALYGLGGYYRESGIFNNVIYAVVVDIIGAVVAGVLVFFIVLSALTSISGFSTLDWSNPTDVSNFFTNYFSNGNNWNTILGWIAGLIVTWVVFIVFLSVGGYLIWRSLRTLGTKSGVGLFGTTGLLIFIGAILTIIGIGLIIIWIGAILLTIAFFQLKPQAGQMAPPPPP
jgi:uncharacterized membrane protein